MDKLEEFMLERGIEKSVIQVMQLENIDAVAIQNMNDEQLARYLPRYGDRVAVYAYCSRKKETNEPMDSDSDDVSADFLSVVGSLRNKVQQKRQNSSRAHLQRMAGNKFAVREERRFELGWLTFDSNTNQYEQVRVKNGGGTRSLVAGKKMRVGEIIDIGKELFFPNGESKKGKVEEFTFEVCDFTLSPVCNESTIIDLYNATKVRMLRLYLASAPLSYNNKKSSKKQKSNNKFLQSVSSPEIVDVGDCDDSVVQFGKKGHGCLECLDETLPSLSVMSGMRSPIASATTPVTHTYTSNTTSLETASANRSNTPPARYPSPPSRHATSFSWSSDFTTSSDSAHAAFLHTLPVSTQEMLAHPISSDYPPAGLTSTPSDLQSSVANTFTLKLHRGNIITEMICCFKNPDILEQKLSVEFFEEVGQDADGISREAYTAFWQDFFSLHSDGEAARVIALKSSWGLEEWYSIGRILVKGFVEFDIFPLLLAPACTWVVLFGENTLPSDILFDSFISYISSDDREVVQLALQDNLLEPDDKDAFIDLLSRHDCRYIPVANEVKPVLLQTAHRRIVQDSKYALDAIGEVARNQLASRIPDRTSMISLYDEKKPTARKVLKLLKSSPVSEAEEQAFKFLQQYIKAQDATTLPRLLRFFTGSDVICVPNIQVHFTQLTGMGRRLISHTCGPTLEMPTTYLAYRDFRHEMDHIMASNYSWQMNIA